MIEINKVHLAGYRAVKLENTISSQSGIPGTSSKYRHGLTAVGDNPSHKGGSDLQVPFTRQLS